MQVNTLRNEFIENLNSWGAADAKSEKPPKQIDGFLRAKAKEIIYAESAEKKGKYEGNKIRLSQVNEEIQKRSNILINDKKILDSIPAVNIFKTIFFWMLPALAFILGDVVFSKEIVVQGWGLGLENPFEKWTLAVAIGMVPFFIKILFDRHLEPGIHSNLVFIKRFVISIYFITGLSIISGYLYLAYYRAVIFKYTKVTMDGNIYDVLYNNHPTVMTWSFIVVAFLFMIAGAALMSIAAKKLTQWNERRKCLKNIQNGESDIEKLKEIKCDLMEKIQTHSFKTVNSQLDREAEVLAKEFAYEYDSTYKSVSEDINQKDIDVHHATNQIDENNHNFHEYALSELNKYSRNGIFQTGDKSIV